MKLTDTKIQKYLDANRQSVEITVEHGNLGYIFTGYVNHPTRGKLGGLQVVPLHVMMLDPEFELRKVIRSFEKAQIIALKP